MQRRSIRRSWLRSTTVLILIGLLPANLALAIEPAPKRAALSETWAKNVEEINRLLAAESTGLQAFYKHLHAHPELSYQEEQTAARLAKEMKALGFEITTGVGGHGVVAVLKNGKGPTVLVRTDMDALPVTEATGLPYASKVRARDRYGKEVGVMHACGHDMHIKFSNYR